MSVVSLFCCIVFNGNRVGLEVCVIRTFTNTLFPVHLFMTIHIYYILPYVHVGGGGAYKYLFPAEKLRASVLSVQCVASTCVRVGMG
jgi:hypothetical protein